MRSRLLWHRADSESAYRGAFILAAAHKEPRYVYATFQGWVIDRSPPLGGGPFVTVLPTRTKGGTRPFVPNVGPGTKEFACQHRQSV